MTDDPRTQTTARDLAAGSNAYARYGISVGWKTHDGNAMPPWFDLGPQAQSGWIAVGRLIEDAVSRETSLIPPLVAVLIDECEHEGAAHRPNRIMELVRALKEVYGYGS